MKSESSPETPATRFLHQHGIPYSSHLYDYEEHGGTRVSSRELNVDEHAVIKTLVMEDEAAKPLIVLMHGDRKVSTKELARQIGCKKVEPCKPEVANRHSGFLVGGTGDCLCLLGRRNAVPGGGGYCHGADHQALGQSAAADGRHRAENRRQEKGLISR